MPHPHVLLSAAVSLDGFLDDTGPDRLLLSGPEDFDRVDQVRAESDAILIGAGTLRTDNPRLLVNSPERRAKRVAAGLPEYPLKVTVSASGDLDPAARFWHTGGAKAVYTTEEAAPRLRAALPPDVDVVAPGAELRWREVLAHLGEEKDVRRLMVEGGGRVHTELLRQGLADELQLVVAPLLVGEADAPRMFGTAAYPPGRMRLLETRAVGDVVLMRYVPTAPGTGSSPRRRTGGGWGSPATWPSGARPRRPRSVWERWWWPPTVRSWPGGSRARAATRRCTRRRPRSRRWRPGTRAWRAPRSTAAWSRAPGVPRGRCRARG